MTNFLHTFNQVIISGDFQMHEPINDYADPIVKAKKHLQNIEHMLRLKRIEEAKEQMELIESHVIKLRNYIDRKNEK